MTFCCRSVPRSLGFATLLAGMLLLLLAGQVIAKDSGGYTRSIHDYRVPDLVLTDINGHDREVRELMRDHPVVMQFIFTTCAGICPVLSALLQSAQSGLEALRGDIYLVSISIDPEYDTPARLKEYSRRLHAGEQWIFLTGSKHRVMRMLKAFDAYYPGNNKMYHRAITYLHPGGNSPWVRLDGLLSRRELVDECKRLLAGTDEPRNHEVVERF